MRSGSRPLKSECSKVIGLSLQRSSPIGRSFVVLAVPGRPPAEPFVYGVIGYLSTLPRLTH
jgi:hypothetical protein